VAIDAVDPNVTIACSSVSRSTFPLGVTPVRCTAVDDAGNETSGMFSITVRDTTAPALGTIAPSQSYLWSPNHVLVDVKLAYGVTDAVSPVACVLTAASDEAVDADGDGSTDVDWIVIDARLVRLRAERDGPGDGRVYTLTVTCKDASANSSTRTTAVYVKKSQSS
jgi:hypothetical protein